MKQFFQRFYEYLKISLPRMSLLVLGFMIVGYLLGWSFIDIGQFMILIVLFVVFQNSFLLESNKSLFLGVIYGIFGLWLCSKIFQNKISPEMSEYVVYFIYLVTIYIIYGTIQSIRQYIRQKKLRQ